MSSKGQPVKEFSTTEKARKQISNIKSILITAFVLALGVSLISTGVSGLIQTYFGPTIVLANFGVTVRSDISWPITLLGFFILFLASWFIMDHYRPETKLTAQIHSPLLYLVGEGTAFPVSTDYYPQEIAKIAFPPLVGTQPERKKQMQDTNPTFQGERSAFAEFYEFFLIFWLHTNLPTYEYRDGLREIQRVDATALDERLQNNTFIDFFTSVDGNNLTTRQLTQLRPRLPKDVDLVYRGPDELDQSGTTRNSFAVVLDGDWCSLEVLVTCIPGHSVSPLGGGVIRGLPLDRIDTQKIQHYSFNDQGPVALVDSHVDVTVEYTFRYLLFSRFLSYNPNAYISWLEDTAQRLTGAHVNSWSVAATAERLQTDQLDDIHQTVKSLQRSLEEAPDSNIVDDNSFQRHLDAIEDEWQSWQSNNDTDEDNQ